MINIEIGKYKYLKQVLIVLLLGTITGFLFSLSDFSNIGTNIFWSIVVWFSQTIGLSIFLGRIERKFPWKTHTVQRIIYSFLIIIFYTSLALGGLAILYNLVYDVMSWAEYLDSLGGVLLITIIVTLSYTGFDFFKEWKDSIKVNEAINQQNALSRYEVLKNQVNPHFLFNSLNVLSELIYEDQDKSARFVAQLSSVYRYILDHKNKEVVSLQEEIDFISSYFFLFQIRHQYGFRYHLNITEAELFQLPPMALQILVENAIKHNIISKAKPLQIDIYQTDDEYLVVKNNFQPKRSLASEKSGIGIKNLKERYAYLTNKEMIVDELEESFIVMLPLLKFNRR